MIKAGTIIEGPLDQAYEITEDIHAYSFPTANLFRAIGNAPPAITGAQMPVWLFNYLWKHFNAEVNDRG